MAKAKTLWKKGESGNPAGRPPGHQSFIDRAKYLLSLHTIASIKEFTADEKKFDTLSVYDGMIMRRIAEAVSADGGQSMDRLLDRLLGKPAQYIEQKIDQTVQHSVKERKDKAKQEADELLQSLAAKKAEETPRVH